MKRLSLVGLGSFLALFATAGTAGAQNWCGNRLNPTEATICANPTLGQLDARMSGDYHFLSNRLQHQGNWQLLKRLKSDQRGWLQSRNGCGRNVACIQNSYQARIGGLGQY